MCSALNQDCCFENILIKISEHCWWQLQLYAWKSIIPPLCEVNTILYKYRHFLHMAFLKITHKEGSLEIALLTTPDWPGIKILSSLYFISRKVTAAIGINSRQKYWYVWILCSHSLWGTLVSWVLNWIPQSDWFIY